MNEICFFIERIFFVTMSNDKTWIKVFQGDESFGFELIIP